MASDGTIYYGSPNYYLYALYPSGSIKWTIGTGAAIYSSPAIDGHGLIFFGSNDANFYAIFPSGSLLWSYYMYSAIKSSAAIDDQGIIYVGTTGGMFYAMNSDGFPLWFVTTTSGSFDISSPVIGTDGTLYIGSCSSDHSLYAFYPTGSVKWQYVTDGIIYSTPSITADENIIITGYQTNYVYSFSSSGSLNWRVQVTTSGASNGASPIIGSDGIIYVSSDSLYALFPTGSLRWISLVGAYPQTPVILSNGLIITGSGSSVYTVGSVISTQTGEPSHGLQSSSVSPKFKGNYLNSVSNDFYPVFVHL